MFVHQIIAAIFSLLAVAAAWDSPVYTNYTRVWQSNFVGKAGPLSTAKNWNVIAGSQNYNNEVQTYTTSQSNAQFSGSGTGRLIPLRNSSVAGGWTSGRLESKYIFTPKAGKVTRVESSLRLAGNPQSHKQGLWPAFWMLGESYREGTVAWPACGEIDVMENINGQVVGYGAVHCDVSPGGICNEGNGIGAGTTLPDNKYHVWRIEINRTSDNFKDQSITWFMDGTQFHRVTGKQITSSSVWSSLAQSPLYFILNMAVGGNWVSSLCVPFLNLGYRFNCVLT